MKIDLEQLRELITTLRDFDLSEIEIERDDEKIKIRRDVREAPIQAETRLAKPSLSGTQQESSAFVTSPFVGTFYRAATPEGEPFVELGSMVKAGTILCIVEAMKLMNEIESEAEGKIVEILVDNGKPVEYGDPLFRIEKS